MQSLEEEALMKGTLAVKTGNLSSSSTLGSLAGGQGRASSTIGGGNGGLEAGAGAAAASVAKINGGDGDEPQTDEEEAYSDQVCSARGSNTVCNFTLF